MFYEYNIARQIKKNDEMVFMRHLYRILNLNILIY